jgi:regulator of cell morphogenesis and NO signaling
MKTINMQPTDTVRQIAVKVPGATRVFQRLGIDFCCGGGASLEEACIKAGLNSVEVLRSLEHEASSRSEPPQEFQSLTELVAYIVDGHHGFTRREIERIDALLDKVCSVHGENHRELWRVRELFRELVADLLLHMQKEERVLFPYIIRLEEYAKANRVMTPPPFMTVRNPIQVMSREHDNAGELLRSLRKAASGYMPPADACTSFRALFSALLEFEQDLHQHIHLENNILFPRAIELEAAVTT